MISIQTKKRNEARGDHRIRPAILVLVLLAVWLPIKGPPTMPRKHRTTLDAVADCLRQSSNPLERRSVYLGRSYHQGIPVLLNTDELVKHMHILGPPGTGKTSLAVETIARQLVARDDGPVVIFDCKGDMGLFNSVRDAAKQAGREFKWFTNRPSRSTYIFNPWDQRLLKRLTLTDILGLFSQSLNLHHGGDYGRAWFSVNIRALLRRAILETVPDAAKRNLIIPGGPPRQCPRYSPIQSFRDLHEILRDLARDSDEFKAAQHLAFMVECLCDFDQLNLAPNTDPNHPALAHAIFMPDVIRNKEVVYFYLAGALDNAAVAEIAKLALYSLFTAATDYHDQHGAPARVYTIWDEAQLMIGQNIENLLVQSRSHGLACIMAHQAMCQLNPPGGVDLRELFMESTHTKMVLGVRDPWLLDYISRTSGATKYYRCRYDLSPEDALAGNVHPAYASPDHDGQQRVQAQEFTAPRLSGQDILDASRQFHVSLTWIDQSEGLCPFVGWFPMYTDYPVTKQMHLDYEHQSWPDLNEATIEVSRLWLDEDDDSTTTADGPDELPTEEDTTSILDEVWQDMHRKTT